MRSAALFAVLLTASTLGACASTAPGAQPSGERAAAPIGMGQGRSPYGLFLSGQAALNAGRAEDAAALFARAGAGAPNTAAIRDRAFAAALTAGDIDRAARLAERIPASDPQAGALARLTRAVDAIAEGRGRDAQALLATGGSEPPHGLAVEILKPWAAAAAGDLGAALAPAGPALTAVPEAGAAEAPARRASPAQLAETLNAPGRLDLLERAGRLPEADALVKALAPAEATRRQALKAGAYLERRRRPAEAAALYEALLAREPSDQALLAARDRARRGGPAPAPPSIRSGAAEALLIPAGAFGAGRQFETALAYARMALHLDPRLSEAQVLVGDLAAASEDLEGARRAYLALEPSAEGYAAARARLALLLNDNGRSAEALSVIRTAVAAAPQDGAVLTAYAALLDEAGQRTEAAKVFDPALATERGRADWRLWYLRGSARLRADQWPEAERDLLEALRLSPEQPDVLNTLGYSWVDRGVRLQEAFGMLQKAVALRPRSGAVIDSLGWAHYRLGQYPAAVEALEQAVELEPGDPEINDHLGDAYWRAGRRIEAQFQWTRALSLEPDPELKAKVQAKLGSPLGPDVVRPSLQAAQP